MAARAYWKGYLRLSLVSCPVALYPATSDREKVHFHRINRKTGHRLRQRLVDEGSGEEVPTEDRTRGYAVDKDTYVEVTDEELEGLALESSRTIDIEQFVPAAEIDQLYNVRPYYVAPEGEVGQQAFAVIREAIRKEGMVGLGRVVLTSREHVMVLEPRGKGLMGTLLRYPYEVRDPAEIFDDIEDVATPREMIDLAVHIVRSKAGHFDPAKLEDRYENALRDLLRSKQAGKPIRAAERREPARVINLMDALRRSIDAERGAGRATPRKRAAPARAAQSRRGTGRARKAG